MTNDFYRCMFFYFAGSATTAAVGHFSSGVPVEMALMLASLSLLCLVWSRA